MTMRAMRRKIFTGGATVLGGPECVRARARCVGKQQHWGDGSASRAPSWLLRGLFPFSPEFRTTPNSSRKKEGT